MLFPLGLRSDTESILADTGEFENSGNPVKERVDNFPIVDNDGEVDQPVYEGPQTWSHTKQLIKANVLMDQLFDVNSGEICDENNDGVELSDEPVEFIKDLIPPQFWYQQAFTVYMVCCDLAEAGACSINC